MKNLLEKIKENKLRSILVGISAFLFGFISVSIFNNIGDTYAESSSDYYCNNSGYKVVSGGGSYYCCPSDYSYVNSTYCGKEADDANSHNEAVGVCGNNNVTQSYGKWYCTTPISYAIKKEKTQPACYYCSYENFGASSAFEAYYYDELSSKDYCEKLEGIFDSNTCLAKNNEKSSCYITEEGKYVYGKFLNVVGYTKVDSKGIDDCYAKNKYTGKPAEDSGSTSTGTGNTGTTEEGNSYVVANVTNYYELNYELAGGKFIDGSTERTEYVKGNNAVGNMKTNPVKEDNIFVEWQYNGKKFDFSKTLDIMGLIDENEETKDLIEITLKAVYKKHKDPTLYCKNKDAVLDYATSKCYTVLKEDESNNIYTHTTYSYEYEAKTSNVRFCYAYEGSGIDETPGGVYFRNDIENNVKMVPSGKQNNNTGVYANYEGNDYWISKETCRIASPCYETSKSKDYPAESCEITYSAILYHEEAALEKDLNYNPDLFDKEEPTPEIPEPDPERPDDNEETPSEGDGKEEPTPEEPDDKDEKPSDGDGKDEGTDKEPSNDKTDQEITENEKTGTAMIIIAWLVGLSALGYTSYYFIRRNRENY